MKTAAVIIAAVLLSGCSTLDVTAPDGTRVKRRSFLTNPNVGPFSITKNAAGTEIKSEGYNHEQTQVAGRALDLAAGLLGK